MEDKKTNLYTEIQKEVGKKTIEKLLIPEYITNNLKYEFFDWQKKSIQYFLAYNNPENEFLRNSTHLMFNMATGTGKTVLMGAMILYYYNQGYRNFLFFVNQSNIVDKTESNFLDKLHNKYIFKQDIIVNNKIVNIESVENFNFNSENIQIKFTTIHKLHNDIYLPKENQLTLEDLNSKDIIILADEAHHLNADTKDKSKQLSFEIPTEIKPNTKESEKSWENTVVNLIFHKNNNTKNNKNVLLEFTATIPSNQEVENKYNNKIIYQFDLKAFIKEGFTKEINLISSSLDKKERILHALLFHWYRHKIALKNNIFHFKPVILFKSKDIEQSKQDYEYFTDLVNKLNIKNFDFLDGILKYIDELPQKQIFDMGKSRTEQVLKFIKQQNISYTEIIDFIKKYFVQKSIIITNSQDNKTKTEKTTQEQEKLLNSLEDKNNHIRAIFTVERLIEGWDVLNLFDIVRLYQEQSSGGATKNTPKSTTQEKQLIGRGVRYYPFKYKDKLPNKRKFDNDIDYELRVLEELYYYTFDEKSRYISELKKELIKDGYIINDKIIEEFDIKTEYQNIFENIKIFVNKTIDNPKRKKSSIENLDDKFKYICKFLEFHEDKINLENKNKYSEKANIQEDTKIIDIKFQDIEKHIFRKSINILTKKDDLFKFENVSKELNINTIDDIQNNTMLGKYNINITLPLNQTYEHISQDEKLSIAIKFLENKFLQLKSFINPKIGDKFYLENFKKIFGQSKIKYIDSSKSDDNIAKNNDWYVLNKFNGTSEEKALIDFVKNNISNLKEKYNQIYLLKNEEVYKIYDEYGNGFQPDFILFLTYNQNIKYQILIESKGNQFLGSDGTFATGKEGWKENFLNKISKRYVKDEIVVAENLTYRLVGLPFFNENNNQNFEEKWNLCL